MELPLTFVQTIVQFIIVYFMINMQGNFIYLVLAAWGLGVASCSVAVLIGCLVSDVKDATGEALWHCILVVVFGIHPIKYFILLHY